MKKFNDVLLIDDDDVTNFINESLIKEMDIANEILIAKNGKEGIDLVAARCKSWKKEDRCPALILVDINMPVMNGFEFLDQYKQMNLPAHLSIILIMLTSSDNERDIERAKHSNAIGYLSKPLTKKKLQDVLEKYSENFNE